MVTIEVQNMVGQRGWSDLEGAGEPLMLRAGGAESRRRQNGLIGASTKFNCESFNVGLADARMGLKKSMLAPT